MERTLTADEQRVAFKVVEARIEAEIRALQDCPLPSFFDDPACCDAQDLYSIEIGIERWEPIDDIDFGTRAMHGHTRGWDAYSEQGRLEYLYCQSCHKIWDAPDIDWD